MRKSPIARGPLVLFFAAQLATPFAVRRWQGEGASHAGSRAEAAPDVARVNVSGANGFRTGNVVRTGSSYASQSETTLTLGLGRPDGTERIYTLEIVWPSGEKASVQRVKANHLLVVQEGQGILKTEPIIFARAAPAPQASPAPPPQGQ
ncbi:MAG: ASPIC/UnbV domain-containing protein [Acidobacteria bacterium]|nr:ASPIC/UnbV domain-containing protein [Acidobacteriota bacterium]